MALCFGAKAAMPENRALGDFAAVQHYTDQNPQANQLASLESFGFFQKHASECCNAPNKGVPDGVSFGRNANQDYHVWRHVEDELGMSRQRVQDAVLADLPPVADLTDGLNVRFVNVDGVRLQYNAFKLPDGTVNIGRIHEAN